MPSGYHFGQHTYTLIPLLLITYWNEKGKPQNLPTFLHTTIQKAKVQLTAIFDKQVRE